MSARKDGESCDKQLPSGVPIIDTDDKELKSTEVVQNNIDQLDNNQVSKPPQGKLRIWLGRVFWTPPWCRYDPKHPPQFSILQNILFAFAGAFTVANLYYNHPILNILAEEFGVSDAEVARIPTLMQTGYAMGLLFICPLGDLFPRRPFTLSLIFLTATLWIVLCLTSSFSVFCGVSFITAITTVTPQIMLPLVGELAPPNRRPLALSIVVSGNSLGVVIARILSGVVTNYTSWRNIYWIALGLQYSIFLALYAFMPAYQATNPLPRKNRFRAFLKQYPRLLYSILQIAFKHPILVQAGLISFCTSVSFMNYWTTLTFLLSLPEYPYRLAPTPIGLFGLIGVVGILMGPLYAKYLIQPLKVALYAVLVGETINLTGCIIGTYTGVFTLAGPVLQALGLDAGQQITQIANRSAIYGVEPTARNRVNTVFMLLTFMGQITGTAAGNEIFDRYGGWRSSGSLSVAIVAFAFLVVAARGPHEKGWIGWGGGWGKTDNRTQDATFSLESSKKEITRGDQISEDRTSSEKEDDNVGEDKDLEAGLKHNSQKSTLRRTISNQAGLTRQQSYGSDGHTIYGDGR